MSNHGFSPEKGETTREREAVRKRYLDDVLEILKGEVDPLVRMQQVQTDLRTGEHPILPFHWEIEFPEVFGRKTAGFDVVVGNPPFLGGTLIGGQLGLSYHDYLTICYPPATGLADIIAFFLRRAFNVLQTNGTLGMIATNTVAQGDTRSTGLEVILKQGASLYHAQRRYKWPGTASVVVSLLHIEKTKCTTPILDGNIVRRISAYLFTGFTDTTPVNLLSNKGICYRGTKIWGSGFVFEAIPSNGSSSLTDLEQLILRDPSNREVVFSYLGGEDFNSSPSQIPSRFVIDFGQMSESQARCWPDLFSIVEQRVRPVRLNNKQRNYRDNWWLHANRVEDAEPFLQQYGRLLAITCVSQHLAFAFVPHGTIIQDRMMLLLLNEDADFAVVQSRLHEVWVRMVGTTLGDAFSYTTTCFDTFPRPPYDRRSALNQAGANLIKFRADLMIRNNEGLTTTYNRFHDPDERSPDILKLRELHSRMDRAVLDAYGWTGISTDCDFFLEYEDDEADEEDGRARKRKKPWRYRWPDEVRDDVLARLLELNAQRAEEERLAGLAQFGQTAKKVPKKREKQTATANTNKTLAMDGLAE